MRKIGDGLRALQPDLVIVISNAHAIVADTEARDAFMRDGKAIASRFDLSADEAGALMALDEDKLRERFSINAMLTYQAKLRVNRPQSAS